MRSAVYYPHTEIQNVEFLKSCLLLWDKIHFIVPFAEYTFDRSRKEIAQALDIVGEKLVPNERQKAETHHLVEEFATRSLPAPFFYAPGSNDHYMIRGVWPQKLLPSTWRMLEDLRLTNRPLEKSDYPLQDIAAMSIMSILADCCAGESFARITDRGAAYATITNLLASSDMEGERPCEHILVPLTLKLVNLSNVSLGRLIYYRQREEREKGHSLRDLRHRYIDRIGQHVAELKHLARPADRHEAGRQFQDDMRFDLLDLKRELGVNIQTFAMTREAVVTILSTIGSAYAFLHPGMESQFSAAERVLAAGGAIAATSRFFDSRLTILRRHPMAYLYELGRRT